MFFSIFTIFQNNIYEKIIVKFTAVKVLSNLVFLILEEWVRQESERTIDFSNKEIMKNSHGKGYDYIINRPSKLFFFVSYLKTKNKYYFESNKFTNNQYSLATHKIFRSYSKWFHLHCSTHKLISLKKRKINTKHGRISN